MMSGKDFHFKEELLSCEIAGREATMRETYRSWSLKELTDAQIAEKETWPHLLEEEINRRRDNISTCVGIDGKKLNTMLVSLDRERGTVTLNKPHKYAVAVASHCRTECGWGKWYWECHINIFERSNGCTISFGWDVLQKDYQESFVPGLQAGVAGDFGIMWTSDGLIHSRGIAEDIFATYDTGDMLGCGIDQDRGLISFYKNGVQIPLIKKKMEYKLPDTYNLVPCVCMFSARLKQLVQVELAFSGPFSARLPKFYKSYSDLNPYKSAVVTNDNRKRLLNSSSSSSVVETSSLHSSFEKK